MKKQRIINIVDGLTGENLYSIDYELLGLAATETIIESLFEQYTILDDHDLQIRTGYRP